MALSWQALESIWATLRQETPATVLEYGSGISTALLAVYALESGSAVKSYDSDDAWCGATIRFLECKGLDRWVSCEFAGGELRKETAQFVMWDYDKNPLRVDLMPIAFANLAVGGVMYVDDMQSGEIRAMFHSLAGVQLAQTDVDGFGRYGAFVRKS